MCPINKTGIHNTFEHVEYVFFLKETVWQPSDLWTLHSPYVGGLVWFMDQVTWNLPDLNGARKAEGCAVSSAAVQAALSPGPMRTQWADQRHQLSGHNRHSEISLLSNRKYTRETSGCSRGDMAALSWRDCGAWASLVRRKEEAVGGCPSDALISVYKERTQCLWLRASWFLKAQKLFPLQPILVSAHPLGNTAGSAPEKLSLYILYRVQWVSCSEKYI